MIVGRFLGWIALLAGFAVLARDLLVWFDSGHWLPYALGQAWRRFDRASLDRMTQLWPFGATIPMAWACAVLIGAGAGLLLLCRARR